MSNPLETNVAQLVSDFDDMKAAIEERAIPVGDSPTCEYGNLIRSFPTGVKIDNGVVVHTADSSGNWVDITMYGDIFTQSFMEEKKTLKSVEFKKRTIIKPYEFLRCTGLTSIEIPASVIDVGTSAFYQCTGLKEVRWGPLTLRTIATAGNSPFEGCPNITNLVFAEGIASIPDNFFHDSNAKLGHLILPEGITYIGYKAFISTAMTALTVPASVTTLGQQPFYGCNSLETIYWHPKEHNTFTRGTSPFQECSAIKNIVYGDGITHIPDWFCHDAGTTFGDGLIIPWQITSIGAEAFSWCNMTKVDIQGEEVSIGDQAFYWCKSLTAVILRSTWVCPLGKNVFGSGPIASGTGYIYVPTVLMEAYQSDETWASYVGQLRAIEDYPDICGEVSNND